MAPLPLASVPAGKGVLAARSDHFPAVAGRLRVPPRLLWLAWERFANDCAPVPLLAAWLPPWLGLELEQLRQGEDHWPQPWPGLPVERRLAPRRHWRQAPPAVQLRKRRGLPSAARPVPAAAATARRCPLRTPLKPPIPAPPASVTCACERAAGRRPRALPPGCGHPAQAKARRAAAGAKSARPVRALQASAVRGDRGSFAQSRTQLVHRVTQPRFHRFTANTGDLTNFLQAQFLLQA